MRVSRFFRSAAEAEAQHAGSSSTLFRTCVRMRVCDASLRLLQALTVGGRP
jgi:hypothetical protein